MYRSIKKGGEITKMLDDIRWICMKCGQGHGFFADDETCSRCMHKRIPKFKRIGA